MKILVPFVLFSFCYFALISAMNEVISPDKPWLDPNAWEKTIDVDEVTSIWTEFKRNLLTYTCKLQETPIEHILVGLYNGGPNATLRLTGEMPSLLKKEGAFFPHYNNLPISSGREKIMNILVFLRDEEFLPKALFAELRKLLMMSL